ncbi:MAG TPA: DUF4126 domain-containing protein [Candidatus Acidoferrum sp.]|nr:DUF4126 domain-containing protein [Candidatus Acidoferrum sp.]
MTALLLSPFIPDGRTLTALLVVICFSAGLNVYATVAMLGVLAHAHVLILPSSLGLVENWYVIAACVALFLVEFVGDKIPVFDLLWNTLQTFVRVPVAALIAYAATSQLPQWQQLLATLAGSLIALAAHGGKTAARAAVVHSPEPVSNIALSLSEDAAVVFLLWFATRHPYAAATIVIIATVVIVLMIRVVVRAMRNLFVETEQALTPRGHTHTNS